jgi:hypothetical protein
LRKIINRLSSAQVDTPVPDDTRRSTPDEGHMVLFNASIRTLARRSSAGRAVIGQSHGADRALAAPPGPPPR